LRDWRALQISPNGQRTLIRLFEVGDGGIEIELTDVTDDQPSDACLLSDAPYDCRRRVKRTCGTGGYREVHDQHVGAPGEINKLRIGAV
jgi:hypothetical protein